MGEGIQEVSGTADVHITNVCTVDVAEPGGWGMGTRGGPKRAFEQRPEDSNRWAGAKRPGLGAHEQGRTVAPESGK